jgi:hypothetical protein
VVSIPACHAGDPGSIPGNGVFIFFKTKFPTPQPIRFLGGTYLPTHLCNLSLTRVSFFTKLGGNSKSSLISFPPSKSSTTLRAVSSIHFRELSVHLLHLPMVKPKDDEKSDGLEITSIGSLYKGPWDKKYWSSSRV